MKRTLLVLLGLLLLAEPAAQAQFTFLTNVDNTLTITGYSGPPWWATIPGTINGLTVSSIGDYAFWACTSLTGVTIPNSITSIGGLAFYDCMRLTSITIPNSVTSIGKSAFEYCSLSSITIGNSVTSIGDDAFCECPNLTSVTIPCSVTSIGAEAFYRCYNLTNVTIPTSVVNIGADAFSYCASLTNLTIPSSVTSIGTNAFLNCGSLVAIRVDPNNTAYSSLGGVFFNKSQTTLIQYPSGNGATSYAIPNGVTSIGDEAFYWNCNLTSVTIPSSITNIGAEAFYSCCNLTNVTIPTSVVNIGAEAFYSTSLTSVTIPSSVPSIGAGAFEGTSLANVTISIGVASIESHAFADCTSLINVTIPASVTNIGDSAFGGCSLLTAIMVNPTNSFYSSGNGVLFDKSGTTLLEFPDGLDGGYIIPSSVTSIGDAFEGSSLTSVTIGNGITNIVGDAFGQCSNLRGIYFQGNAPDADLTIFTNDNNVTVYYVPGTAGWGSTFVGPPTGLWDPQIQCTYMITNGMIIITGYIGSAGAVTVPITINGLPVTCLGINAFNNCYTLTNVTIPNSVTCIGEGAFSSTGLTSVIIPNSVTSIGTSAFADCPLTNITIPSSVTDIKDYAFSGTSLTSLTIPNTVTNIGDDAFEYCYRLTSVYFQGNAPSADSTVFESDNATVYYFPGTTGWGTTFGGVQTKELAALLVTTFSLPNGTNDVVFSQQLNASGGKPPYTWTLIAGGLPKGLTLGTSGLISGAPTTNGTFNFTVKLTDATNSMATQPLSLTINSGVLQVTTPWLLGGMTTVAYSQTMTASGGQPPYIWTNIMGALPPGLSLAANGVIAGTPAFAGTANFTVKVTDTAKSTATQALSLNISVFAPLQITMTLLPNGTSGVAYSQQLSAIYGQPPYSWSLISGSLPPGLTLAANGSLSGISTSPGRASFTVSVTDALSTTETETLTLTVMLRILHTFAGSASDGANPYAGLMLSSNILYGTTIGGGSSGNGSVFSVNTDGTGFRSLHDFSPINNYINNDGANPYGGVILSGNTLYGTVSEGGSYGYGTVFAVNTDGTHFRNLHDFNFDDGFTPWCRLVLSGNTLYGTTLGGGSSLGGTVFAVNTDGSRFTTVHAFSDASDGSDLQAGLILSGSTLYGTAFTGGSSGGGTVFAVNVDGTGFTNLHSFTAPAGLYSQNSDGFNPSGALTLSDGILYGTATTGGSSGAGTVFAVSTNGTGFSTLLNFGPVFVGYYDGGTTPYGALALSGNTLYGTTSVGDTVFEVNTDGTGFMNLYALSASDGEYPMGNLVLSGNTLYGTADWGGGTGDGGLGYGTVFSLSLVPYVHYASNPTNGVVPLSVQFTSPAVDSLGNAITSWNWNFGDGSTSTNENTLHVYTNAGTFLSSLVATNNLGVAVPGSGPSITAELSSANPQPSSGLVLNGGFEIGDFTGWTLTGDLYAFVDDGSHSGTMPYSGNYEAELGTLSSSGQLSQTLFTVAGAGYLLSLWLNIPDGQTPNEFLVSWNGHTLFDETNIPAIGWTNLQFLVSAPGTSTVLEFGCLDAPGYLGLDEVSVLPMPTVGVTANPTNGVVPLTVSFTSAAVDSTGHTITSWNWSFGDGSTSTAQNPSHTYTTTGAFSPSLIATNNIGATLVGVGPTAITATPYSNLHSFTALSNGTNSDGANPVAGLILSGNTLYGTALSGGTDVNGTVFDGAGVIFSLNTNGTGFKTLYAFTNGTDGAWPEAGLILSGNTMYGTAAALGCSPDYGTVFALNGDGTGFRTLYVFTNGSDGANPLACLILSGNMLYGTAYGGGDANGDGTVFSLNTDGTGFRSLYAFTNGSDGAGPFAGLVIAGNSLYGTAVGGGDTNGDGTVFFLNSDGTDFKTLYAFTNGSDGAGPVAALILSGNTLYGTASKGGSSGYGTVFGLNTNGTGFKTLYAFTNGSDGAYPDAALILSGTTLYGTAYRGGGTNDDGTVFSLNTNGTGFQILYGFTGGSNGANPTAGLILSGNTMYGTTVAGGAKGKGTVFSLSLPVGSFAPAQPGIASVGLSGANLVLNCTDGQSGGTYYVLMSTNLALPLSQWTPVATNVLSTSGNFNITVTKTVTRTVPIRFYILQTQ